MAELAADGDAVAGVGAVASASSLMVKPLQAENMSRSLVMYTSTARRLAPVSIPQNSSMSRDRAEVRFIQECVDQQGRKDLPPRRRQPPVLS